MEQGGRSGRRTRALVAGAFVAGLLCASPVQATTFVVNTSADELGFDPGNGLCETAPGNGLCTLRRAMAEAEAMFTVWTVPTVTIILDVPGGVISLDSTLDSMGVQGNGEITIVGTGPARTRIETNGAAFVLQLFATRARVSGLTIRGARTAIVSGRGSLMLDHVRVLDSIGTAVVLQNPEATFTECEFSGNAAIGPGGAVHMDHGFRSPSAGALRIRRSVLQGNSSLNGGAIAALSGTVTLEGVTLSGNHAFGSGGALLLAGQSALVAVNSTFSANSADVSGGAISVADPGLFLPVVPGSGTATLLHVTLANNQADADSNGTGRGGSIAVDPRTDGMPGVVSIDHTILSGGTQAVFAGGSWIRIAAECQGALTATGPTLFSLVDCSVSGVTPTVGPANLSILRDNGGPTHTHLPLPGSLAINAGATAPCRGPSGTTNPHDQRRRLRPATGACDLGAVEVAATALAKGTRYDLDGNGNADLVWRQQASGHNAAWLMSGGSVSQAAFLLRVDDPGWTILASDDFDGDGKADLLWRRASDGLNAVWLMDGAERREGIFLPPLEDSLLSQWRLAGTGDLDGDGRADLVWEEVPYFEQQSPGRTVVWLLDGGSVKGFRWLPLAPGWRLAGAGDADGDLTADLLWRHESTGGTALWLMADADVGSGVTLPTVPDPDWRIVGFSDLDADGKADLVWRNVRTTGAGAGETAAWILDGGTVVCAAFLPTVRADLWVVEQVADADGDGRADLVWRARNGQNARWRMNGLTIQTAEYLGTVPDLAWEIQ